MKFKAFVIHRKTRELKVLEYNCLHKDAFVNRVRGEGYSVDPAKVKRSTVFDEIFGKYDI